MSAGGLPYLEAGDDDCLPPCYRGGTGLPGKVKEVTKHSLGQWSQPFQHLVQHLVLPISTVQLELANGMLQLLS